MVRRSWSAVSARRRRSRSRSRSPLTNPLVLTLCVSVCVLWLGGVVSGAREVIIADPESGEPGVCDSDAQCSPGYICTDDGLCQVAKDNLPPGRVYSARQVTLYTILGTFGVCICSLVAGKHFCNLRFRDPDNWTDHEWIGFATTVNICTWVTIASVFWFGLGLAAVTQPTIPDMKGSGAMCTSVEALACDPYFCDMRNSKCYESCKTSAECVSDFECVEGKCSSDVIEQNEERETRLVEWWGAVLIALLPGCCICVICTSCCFLAVEDEMNGDQATVTATSCGICMCVVFALTVALPVGVSKKTISFAGLVTNGTQACESDRPCYPYTCSHTENVCRDVCSTDEHCLSPYQCNNGFCYSLETGVYTRRPAGEAWAIALAVAFGVACCCGVASCFAEEFENVGAGLMCFFCVLVTLSLTIGLPMSLSTSAVTFQYPGNGTQCADADAPVCEPYYCDLLSSRCHTNCADDDECRGGMVCNLVAGVCEYVDDDYIDSAERESRRFLFPTYMIICATVAISCCIVRSPCAITTRYFEWVWPQDPDTWTDRHWAAVMCGVGGCIVSAIVVGVVLGVWQEGGGVEAAKGVNDAANCTLADSGRCFPYTCDLERWKCREECEVSAGCAEGYVCRRGHCVQETDSHKYVSRNWYKLYLFFGGVVAFTLACLFCSCFCYGCDVRRNVLYGLDWSQVVGILFVSFLFIGVGVGTVAVIFPATGPAALRVDKTACLEVDSYLCKPYMCNTERGQCFKECDSVSDCQEGYTCSLPSHTCVEENTGLVRDVWAASVTVVVVTVLVVTLFPSIKRAHIRRRLNLELRALAESEREQREYFDRLARIPKATVDLHPHGPDFTVCGPTPASIPAPTPPSVRSSATTTPTPTPAKNKGKFPLSSSTSESSDGSYSSGESAEESNYSSVYTAETSKSTSSGSTQSASASYSNSSSRAKGVGVRSSGESTSPGARSKSPGAETTTTTGDDDAEGELCSVCFAEVATVRFLARRECTHSFCESCARMSLESVVSDDRFPATCPGCFADAARRANASPRRVNPNTASNNNNTNNNSTTNNGGGRGGAAPPPAETPSYAFMTAAAIEHLVRRHILQAPFGRRFVHLSVLRAFARTEILTCPACDLLCTIPQQKIGKTTPYEVTCPNCETPFCGQCNELFFNHRGISCEDMGEQRKGNDNVTASLLKRSTKPCPNCGIPISHYRGHACHHIMPGSGCPSCGYHFCIVCLQKYPCDSRGHGMFCDDRCDCPPCPDCKPGRACNNCPGNRSCPSCAGEVRDIDLFAAGAFAV